MTAALTSDDLTVLRNLPHRASYYLSLMPATSFATARINQAIFNDPIVELTVDNTSADWLDVTPGMTVWVGSAAGLRDKGVYRVRKAPTSTDLYLGEFSPGDPGLLSVLSTAVLADNDHITVLLDYNAWSVFPYIAYSDGEGTFFKDWEIAYSTQNETAIPGILRLGPHGAGWCNDDDEFPFTILSDVETWDSATVSTYAWTIDGDSAGTGSSLSHDYPPGAHVVRCTVTLSNGASMSAVRFVHAHHPVDYPPIDISISSDRRNRQGRTINMDLDGAWDAALLEGALAIVWEDITWGAHEISSATTHTMGFIRSLRGRMEPGIGRGSFELVSPLLLLNKLVAFSQQLTYNANPSTWTQAVASLMHFDFFTFYLLYWHSTILALCDLVPSGLTDYVSNVWKVDPGNHLAQINRAGESIRVQITQRSDGTLFLKCDPMLMSDSERAGVVERYPLTEDDATTVDYERSLQGDYGKVVGLAFEATTGSEPETWAATAFKSGGQGANVQQFNGLIVLNLDELKRWVSCMLAKLNNPIPRLTVELLHGYDVIEPAEWQFFPLALPADIWPEGVAIDFRTTVEDVSMSYAGPRKTTLTLIPETNGNATPAQQTPIIIGNDIDDIPLPSYDDNGLMLPEIGFDWGFGGFDLYGFPATFPPPLSLTDPDLGTPGTVAAGTGILIAWAEKAGVTSNPFVSSPLYDLLADFTGETIKAMIHSNNSPWLTNASDPLIIWALTDEKLYYNSDALGVGTWVDKQAIRLGKLLRKPAGVPNGIVVYGGKDTVGAWTVDFLDGDGLDTHLDTINFGTYNSSDDRIDGAFRDLGSVDQRREAFITFTFPEPTLITSLEMDYDVSPTGTVLSYGNNVRINNSVKTQVLESGAATGTVSWSGSETGTSIQFQSTTHSTGAMGGHARITRISINGTDYNPFDDVWQVHFSDDTGDTITTTEIDARVAGESGYDPDDFDLGIHVVTANHGAHYTTAYDGAFTALVGLTGLDGENLITCIRVPYKKLLTQELNDDPEALQFIYATDDGGLWAVTFDTTDGSIVNQTDISISISGTDYYVIGPNALETNGLNTQRILALAKPVGGGNTRLIYSGDGGDNWVVKQSNIDAVSVKWVEGSLTRAVITGAVGIRYTENIGSSVLNKDGDFEAEIADFPAEGGYILDQQ